MNIGKLLKYAGKVHDDLLTVSHGVIFKQIAFLVDKDRVGLDIFDYWLH